MAAEARAAALSEAVAVSPAARALLEQVRKAAQTDLPVLLHGESGSGKSFWARQIHLRGPRAGGPLVIVDAAGIPSALMESELFGHAKGAFTDAFAARPGRLETAAGGTVVLENLAEIPPSIQAKLLRVVEEKIVQRLGESKLRALDIRFAACAPARMEEMLKSGVFREDLYFRLNVLPLTVPPLRERCEDIVPLARLFLERFARAFGRGRLRLGSRAAAVLEAMPWPGNVRELQNAVERAAASAAPDSELSPTDFQPSGESSVEAMLASAAGMDWTLQEVERMYVCRILAREGGNASRAAKILGVTRGTVYGKAGLAPRRRRKKS